MFEIDGKEYRGLRSTLKAKDLESTAAKVASLLTVPECAPHNLRLELLAHLVVHTREGKNKTSDDEIIDWCEKILGRLPIRSAEDPPEDLFVTNVAAPWGNDRIFGGTWESSEFFVEQAISALSCVEDPGQRDVILAPIRALLAVSDCIAERVGLARWHPPGDVAEGRLVREIGAPGGPPNVTVFSGRPGTGPARDRAGQGQGRPQGQALVSVAEEE